MLGYYNYTVILTYIGMMAGLSGIFHAMRGSISGALMCLMIAGVCDMFDGKIASTMVRTTQEKRFGIQIDSLSDLVCFGVLPAVIVCSVSALHRAACFLGGCYVLCALIRLAWFNVDEEERQTRSDGPRECYLGLPVTTSALFLPALMGLARLRSWPLAPVGMGVLGVMGLGFLTPFQLKKPQLPGKLALLMCGGAELVILLLGVSL